LGPAEFGALFKTEREAALAPVIRDRLRAYIPIDPALVRPDDKLCAELQLAVFDGLDANAFVAEVEKAVGVKIPDQEAEKMFTLRDIVSYLAARDNDGAT
jgi:acyl carrier protein